MDDTAQQSTQSGPGVVTPASPTGQAAVVNRPMVPPIHDRAVAGTTPAATVKDDTGTAPTVPDDAVSRRNPEQGPIAVAAPAETPDVQIEASQPPVEVSSEMKDAGVEPGVDAKEHELPDEVKEIGAELAKEATPVAVPAQTPPAHVEKSFEESLLEAKASKTPKSSLSWYLRIALREWKKKLFEETGEVPK
jgi:hypothetical protein